MIFRAFHVCYAVSDAAATLDKGCRVMTELSRLSFICLGPKYQAALMTPRCCSLSAQQDGRP